MKYYKLQNVITGEFLSKSKKWTNKGSVWKNYPIVAIYKCINAEIEINLITYKLTLLEIKAIKLNGKRNNYPIGIY